MDLMEAGVEDGEEAATFDSTYVNVSCVVTSDTDGISSTAGEYDNSRTSLAPNPPCMHCVLVSCNAPGSIQCVLVAGRGPRARYLAEHIEPVRYDVSAF